MLIKTKRQGFTLIEMLIVIIVVLILVSISTTILVQNFQLFNTGQDLINADWQGRVALERMTRDMRNVTAVTAQSNNTVTFIGMDGNETTYSLVTNQLVMTTAGSTTPLADNIQSVTFSYYDGNGSVTAQLSNIRYIIVTLNIVTKQSNFNLTTAVYLWNIKP